MENNQILMRDKLGFFDIIKESLRIPAKNSSFIFLTFLASLPPFCFLLLQELVLQHGFNGAAKSQTYEPTCLPGESCLVDLGPWYPSDIIMDVIQAFSRTFILLAFLYLGIGHLSDLLNTVIVVHSASMIYAGNDTASLKEMLFRPFREVGLKGPFITSIYTLALVSLTFAGLISFGVQIFASMTYAGFISYGEHIYESMTFSGLITPVFLGLIFVALLIKYVEWSAIWNMGLVISILEEKHGYVGIGVSGYISRGSRRRGFFLMIVFFVWKVILRLSCGYLRWNNRKSGSVVLVAIAEASLVCFGEVMKWVVATVYYYDCKKRFLEKKVDLEQARAPEATKQ